MNAELSILLIDDDADDRALARSVLEQRLPNARIVEAATALDFAREFAEGEFAVAVSELELSWGDGAEVLTTLRRRNPECAVVLFTRAELASTEHARLGAHAYLRKTSAGFVQLPRAVEEAQRSAARTRGEGADAQWNARLWERLPVGVFTLSASGEVLRANPALARTLGFEEPVGLLGRQLPDLVTGAEMRLSLRRRLEQGEACEDLPVELRTVTDRSVNARMSLWPSAEGERRYQGILVAAPALAAAPPGPDGDLQQLTFAVLDELTEPLQLLAQLSGLLGQQLGDALSEDSAALLGRIRELAERARGMVLGVREHAASRWEQHRPLQRMPLEGAVADALQAVEAAITASGAQVEIGELPTVTGDRELLAQLFRHLLANALKFRGDAPPRIAIRAEERSNDWLIAVTDNGVGIDPDAVDRIFETFTHLHEADAYAGAGVGLAICRRVAQWHGGDLWVRPAESGGSTFLLTLAKHIPPRRRRDASTLANAGR